MSLIDKTYFTLGIDIPDSTYSTLAAHITKYEKEILIDALGYTLYKAMIDNTSDEPYKSIIEGKDYTVSYNGDNHTVHWNGLTNSEKESLIAYYVYYWWVRNYSTLTLYTGQIKPDMENAMQASPAMKISNAWNRLTELYGYPGQDALEPSLYNFLLHIEDDYTELDTWVFKCLGSVNGFDL